MKYEVSKTLAGISFVQGLIYIFGFWVLILFIHSGFDEQLPYFSQLQFFIDKKTLYQIWVTLIYVVFGLLLIPLALGLNGLFPKEIQKSLMAKSSLCLALIWSAMVISSGMIAVVGIESIARIFTVQPEVAQVLWQNVQLIHQGIGGSVEIVGGAWVLLISLVGLKSRVFLDYVNYIGIAVGISGLLTIFPPLKDAAALFGITQILWFFGVSLSLGFCYRPTIENI